MPLSVGALRVEPFLFGGVGWTYYQVVKSDINTSGTRFTYRAVVDDKLVPANGSDHLDLQNWSAGLTGGYEL